jgi:transcriptional regulator CtsR
MHTINSIGDAIDATSTSAFLQNLSDILGAPLYTVISAACSDRALRGIDPAKRDEVRASILKQCLLHTF